MMSRVGAVLAVLILNLIALPASGQDLKERFESVSTQFTIRADGTLDARHEISVIAAGDQVKRGIYLDFHSSFGPLSDLLVLRDGAPEPYQWEDGDLIIKDGDKRLTPGRHDYVLTYRVMKPFIRKKNDAEEGTFREAFYWGPLMRDSDLPWVVNSLDVSWPSYATPLDGTPGTTRAQWRWRGPLGSDGNEGIGTVSISWPEGTFPAETVRVPSVSEMLRFGGPLGFFILLLLFHTTWRNVGKDRAPGPIAVTSDPPRGYSPAATRYITKMGFDGAGMIAGLVNLAIKGVIRFHKPDKKSLALELKAPLTGSNVSVEERALAETLFDGESSVTLKRGVSRVVKAMSAMSKALKAEYQGRMFKTNTDAWWPLFAIALAFIGFLIWTLIAQANTDLPDKVGLITAIVSFAATLIMSLIYLGMFKAPTREGRSVMDQADGLKLYLEDEALLTGDALDPAHFFALLPYAVALDSQKEWEARFGTSLEDSNNSDVKELLEWYREIKAQAKKQDDATFVAVILPAIIASNAGSAGAAGAGGAGGGSAGGV